MAEFTRRRRLLTRLSFEIPFEAHLSELLEEGGMEEFEQRIREEIEAELVQVRQFVEGARMQQQQENAAGLMADLGTTSSIDKTP